MDEQDLHVRNVTYAAFVELGRTPTLDEVAATAGLTPAEAEVVWRNLHDAHALVLDENGELRMAHPFSAVETPYRVHAAGRAWYGNCAWDAFGICAALHVDGEIEAACFDCGDPILVRVRDQTPDDERLLFHVLVPAAHWWDDIVFT
jgi:alkylmercury lyase-like protein